MSSLLQAIFQHSTTFPEKTALIYQQETLSYQQLTDRITAFAATLKERKIKKGSRIMIEADHLLFYFCAFFGCQLAGCIAVPFEKNISIYRLQNIMKTTKPTLVFLKNNGEKYQDFFHPQIPLKKIIFPKKEEDAAIINTTGTTGNPVPVSHTQESMLAVTQNLAYGLHMDSDSVLLTNIPFHLATGYRRVLAALYLGATAVITEKTLTYQTVQDFIEKYGITILSLVSSNLGLFIEEIAELPHVTTGTLTAIESAAGTLSHDIILKCHNTLPAITLYNVYGTTESGCILMNNTNENYNQSCIGKPACNAEVFLVDENEQPITTPGKYGHIAVKGPMNMKGYYKKKALTDKVMRKDFLILSDIAYFDEDHYFYYVSRVGDVINISGNKIIPEEIETIAKEFEGVLDCACSAKENPSQSQMLVLYVVCKNPDTFDFEKMQLFLREQLESYRIPKSIIPVERIPRTATGKLMRKSLGMDLPLS